MAEEPLADALEREHHEIDEGIEAFMSALSHGDGDPAPLVAAIHALRRHIYLEEEFLFPPLGRGGFVAPVFVMLREHAQMWATLASLERELRSHASGDLDNAVLAKRCDELVVQLQHHNSKEEQILYPQADHALPATTAEQLKRFLDVGELPDGWVCQQAR
ncbi:MAG: hemerythrin domain-containing protein [Acidothermaceae bacterium]